MAYLANIKKGDRLLTISSIFAVILGLLLGYGLYFVKYWNQQHLLYFKFIGEIYLRILNGLTIPLIVSSIVVTIGSMDLSLSRKIGLRAILYYLGTSFIAAITGLILVATINPGRRDRENTPYYQLDYCVHSNPGFIDTVLDIVRNLFPENHVGATMQVARTELAPMGKGYSPYPDPYMGVTIAMIDGTNLLGLVVLAVIIGITLRSMNEAGKPLLNIFIAISDVVMKITSKLTWFCPIAIFFLVCGNMLGQVGVAEVKWHFLTILVADMIHFFITLPLIYLVITKSWPIRFFTNMLQALATAFGMNSSTACLPMTLDCLENKNKIDRRISRFIAPMGATVNMDSIALHLPISVIYIAQMFCMRNLGFQEFALVFVLAIIISFGQTSFPGIVLLSYVPALVTIGVPKELVFFILPLNWLIERLGAVLNVLSSSYSAAIIAHLCNSDFDKEPLVLVSSEVSEESLDKPPGVILHIEDCQQ